MSHRFLRSGGKETLSGCLSCIHSFLITSKSAMLNERYGKVVCRVSNDATKPMIKRAFESMFEIKVKSMCVIRRKGVAKVVRGVTHVTPVKKRAILTIDGHFNVSDMLGAE